MLLQEIFNYCDRTRIADQTESELVGDLEVHRNALIAATEESMRRRLETYFEQEIKTESYVERAYFYDGFRAAVRLMNESGIEPVVKCFLNK